MAGGQERILRRRIKSVQATRKITKAMELIAASQISRSQARIYANRPYRHGMQRIIVREVERKKTCSAADSCKTLSQKARTTRYRVGSTLERE